MSDQALRSKLIRLAHANPELRPQIMPLLGKTAKAYYDKYDRDGDSLFLKKNRLDKVELTREFQKIYDLLYLLEDAPGPMGEKARDLMPQIMRLITTFEFHMS